MLFAARGRGGLLIIPRPLLGCQIKAEIKGFLLMYGLIQYQQWFFQDIERHWIPEMTSAPCSLNSFSFQRYFFFAENVVLKVHMKKFYYIYILINYELRSKLGKISHCFEDGKKEKKKKLRVKVIWQDIRR